MAELALQAEALRKRYGKTQALDGTSFRVERGSLACLLGPTDSGKTTVMKALLGLITLDGGRAQAAGCDSTRDSMALRRAVGYAPQAAPFDPTMTTETVARFAADFALDGAAVGRAVTDALATAGLKGKENTRVPKLKKPALARLALAQAFAGRPAVVLLDSSATELDPLDRGEWFDQLKQLQAASGATVLYSSHLVEDAEYADQLIFLVRGKVVREAAVSEITTASTHRDDPRRAIEEAFKALLRANPEQDE